MLDRDLAKLYGVETKYPKRQVRRNTARFPDDFMFDMTPKEFQNWRCQNGTSNSAEKMGLRYAPMVFTEHGVAQLSSVINSKRALRQPLDLNHIIGQNHNEHNVELNHRPASATELPAQTLRTASNL